MFNRQLKFILTTIFCIKLLVVSIFAQETSKVDSIKNLLSQELDDSTRFVLNYELFKVQRVISEIDAASLALRITDSIERYNTPVKPWQFISIARYLLENQKYEKSKEYFQLALEYYSNQSDYEKVAEAYALLSFIAYYQGQNELSIDYSQKQYFLSKRIKDRYFEIDAIITLGFIYLNQGDYERSDKYLNEAYQLSKANNSVLLLVVLMDLGMLKTLTSKYEEALKYHFEALDIAKKRKSKTGMAHLYLTIGNTYLGMNYIDKALENYLKSKELMIQLGDKSNMIDVEQSIGVCYQQLDKYENALNYFNHALELAHYFMADHKISAINMSLAQLHLEFNEYTKAYNCLKLYKTYKDSTNIEERIKTLAEIQTKFETERTEIQAEILTKENELNKIRLTRNKNILSFIAFATVALVVIFLIVMKRNRIRIRQKIVELKQQNLRNQMNPHFIFNTLNSIQYYLFMNNRELSSNYLSKFARLLNLVFENSKHKYVPIKEELLALELYLELEKLRFKESLNYKIKVDESIDVIDYKIPPLILQPFVENAIIHGIMPKEDIGNIEIALKSVAGIIVCSIKDDGIGREKAFKIKLEKKVEHKSLGTKISEDRLKNFSLLYHKKLKIEYLDLKDEHMNALGTEVLLSFPIVS